MGRYDVARDKKTRRYREPVPARSSVIRARCARCRMVWLTVRLGECLRAGCGGRLVELEAAP